MQTLDDGKIGERGLLARQIMEALGFERMLDGAQAVGALGMTEARIVLEAGGMGEEKGWSWAGELRTVHQAEAAWIVRGFDDDTAGHGKLA